MNKLERSFHRVVADLSAMGCATALVGGLAVSVHTKVRFTRDVDLAVMVSGDREAEALVRTLIGAGYGVVAMIEQEQTGRFAMARLVTPDSGPAPALVNMLFASSGIEPEIVAEATEVEVESGIRGKVARVGHLVALKLLSRDAHMRLRELRRPQDWIDLVELIKVADEAEIERGFAAAALIEARGFARDRQLVEDLKKLLAELRG
jgi:hypothetical protein